MSLKSILIILLLFVFQESSYTQKQDSTRILRGHVYTDEGEQYIGLSITEYGTNNSTVSQIDGSFELEIPTNEPILLCVPFCFQQYYRIIDANENNIVVFVDLGNKRKNKKVLRKWNRLEKGISY